MTRRLWPLALFLGLFLATPAQAAPGPPSILKQSVAEVSTTAATLKATVNPGERETEYHFDYLTQAAFEAEGFSGATSVPVPNGTIPAGSANVTVEARIEGLTPGTAYRFHLFAKNPSKVTGEDASFSTLAPPPTFGPCPNDAFRLGQFAFGGLSARLPDCRAYEQATPVDKDGGDAVGEAAFTHAAGQGAGITFGSTYGVPGAEGTQVLPFFAAVRNPGEAGWQTKGLLPPAATGDKARVRGWLPDFSQSFAEATKLTKPRLHALYELHRDGTPPTQIAPYVPTLEKDGENFFYDGASADGQTVVFESPNALPATAGEEPIPGARDRSRNVYAWDAATERLHLVSALNSTLETEAALPKGGFAGPYGWASGRTGFGGGGPEAFYYLQDNHAVSSDGSVYFTAAGSGDLYQRLNPTQPQSPLDGSGECEDPALACTIELSASTRTEPDPGGPRPAAFQFASTDGSTAYFTSAEELTDDANTGPDQDPAQIGRATIGPEEAEDPEPGFLPVHALGIAVDPKGEYVYWADPVRHSIGRANLKAPDPKATEEPEFIVPGETSCDCQTGSKLGEPVFEHLTAPTAPRYVALDEEGHLYWTNTGPLAVQSPGFPTEPVDGGGTIGRADLQAPDPQASVEAEFITGASNPQGIAANAEHVYWANAAKDGNRGGIGRASLEGDEAKDIEQTFLFVGASLTPFGVALDADYVYFTADNIGSNISLVFRQPLGKTEEREALIFGNAGLRGIALAGTNLFWVSESEHAIARIPIADFPPSGKCSEIPTCQREYYIGGFAASLEGLASDGPHLYFSTNGETPPNPGNDLYRYRAGDPEPFADLTPDPGGENGAGVQGVLGGSDDGSYLYFVANGVLASNEGADGSGPAEPGDCMADKSNITQSKGECNLYLLHEGTTEFIARIPSGKEGALAWAPTPILSQLVTPKTSTVASDGRTLLLSSTGRLTPFDNEGVNEFYRYRVGEGISCVSCSPSGATPTFPPGFQKLRYPGSVAPNYAAASLAVHLLSTDGNRAFFETTEALVGADTNGEGGCPVAAGSLAARACTDVYEWEAPGTGTCSESTPAFSPLNQGCIYLISPGTGPGPSLFADASPSGSDVYFFTRQQLVGQDEDELFDVYDARVQGGLAAQNPLSPPPCEGEGCKGPATSPPPFTSPPAFSGPPNPKPTRHGCRPRKGKRGCHGKKHHGKSKKNHKPHAGHGGRRPPER